MILLQAQKIARHFGGDTLFDQVNLEIKSKARIGLVGRNGAGKSTILHILAGLEEPDEGKVSKQKGLTVGFLDQHSGLDSDRTIMEEMLSVFSYVIDLEKRLRKLEQAIADDTSGDSELLAQYDKLQTEFLRLNGYGYHSEIKMVLHGFKFYEEDYDTPINHLSGGQKTRLALAKLLLENKDLLILDEPTNHLDIETLAWLESYLKNYQGALLIVSHDRYFLDRVITETYEVAFGGVTHFPGNYSNYLKLKSEHIKQQWKEYEKQQKKISELEDFIQKNIVRASTTKRAQARRKQLEKMDKMEKPQDHIKSAHFSFHTARTSGDIVIQASDLAIGYDGDSLSQGIDLDIRKGDAIALVGPNGIGKTTLIKTLVDMEKPLEGDIKYGTKVDVGYYDQEQETLSSKKTVLDELWDDHPTLNEVTIRTLLGSFLFSGDDVDKTVASLSGGERARVALAKLALEENNFLVLDEPTNHLDIDSKEVLENALIDFEGTLLFVSHDRYFINRMATKVIELHEDGADLYLGDYDYYLQKKEELQAIAQAKADQANTKQETSKNQESQQATVKPAQSKSSNGGSIRQKQKAMQKEHRRLSRQAETIEDQLEAIDREISELSDALSEPDVYDNPKRYNELANRLQTLEADQIDLMMEWESIEEALVEMDQSNL